MQSAEIQQKREILQKWRNSPVTRHYSFSDKQVWDKQAEALWSVRNNKYTCIKSGNTVGKSFIAADIVMDYLTIHYPSKVITTAPGWNQVEEILWKEIALYVNNSKIPIGAELLKTHLKFKDDHFALGLSTNEVHRFQGFHSPHLLVVIDEASGVSPEIWEAVYSLHPHRILAIGNPLDNSGNFCDCFTSTLWHKITISCYDCVKWQETNKPIPGLVTREWIEEMRGEWGDKSSYFQVHVLGEFPEEGESCLISRKWVENARGNKRDDDEEEEPRILSTDVATKHGENETVIGYRYGHTQVSLDGFKNISMTDTRDKLAHQTLKRQITSNVFDSDGVGEGLGDILRERHVPYTEFHGGYGQVAYDKTKFRNLRTQFYYIVAKKFEKGMYDLTRLPAKEYEILKNQLCQIKVKNPDGQGRLQIETKEDMHARQIKSPDFADAFMMGEYGFYMGRYAEVKGFAYR